MVKSSGLGANWRYQATYRGGKRKQKTRQKPTWLVAADKIKGRPKTHEVLAALRGLKASFNFTLVWDQSLEEVPIASCNEESFASKSKALGLSPRGVLNAAVKLGELAFSANRGPLGTEEIIDLSQAVSLSSKLQLDSLQAVIIE